MDNPNTINANNPVRGIQSDVNTSLVPENQVIHARNASMFSHEGDIPFYQTEHSLLKVCDLPFSPIGDTPLPDGTVALFLSNDDSSEIGIFDEVKQTYTKKLNAPWLNFNRSSLITAASKQNPDGSFSVYWSDGRRNPDRILNLSKIEEATYDSIRLAKLITPPQLTLQKSTGGVLPNGSYSAGIFYSVAGQRFGNFYSLTTPEAIFSETNPNGSLIVSIDGIDNDFTEFQLVIIQTTKGTTTAKIIGTFPKHSSKIYITSFDKAEYLTLSLEQLVVENDIFFASDQISSNNQYLFRAGTESVPDPNYQLQAFEIESEYVMWQVPEDYHSYGDKVGLYRDEVYSYFVQLLHKTGKFSSAFHTPGRKAKPSDTGLASQGSDVYESTVPTCTTPEPLKVWQVENTASFPVILNPDRTSACKEWELGYGECAYWESKDTYPENVVQYGDNAGQPIRLIKTPDEEKAPRYSVIEGKSYVNILGVRFKNIPHPKKADGTQDTDWVGYRIIRADRNGNRSVESRGLLTNVRGYKENLSNTERDVLYTNYPINDLRPDSFISQTQTVYKNKAETNYTPLTTFYKDKFVYYSPNNLIGRFSLGSEMKVESEEVADVDGQFTEVYQHPKHKLLSLFSFWIAAAMGSVQALITTLGTSNLHSESEFKKTSIDAGLINKFSRDYKIETAEDLIGLDIVSLTTDAILALNAGAVFSAVKDIVLVVTSLALKVLTFTFIGIQYADMIINTIWNFLGYTNYTLQYNCHAFFNRQVAPKVNFRRRYVSNYQYLQPGLQSIQNQLFNNFGKQEGVFVQLNTPLTDFVNQDNSRQTLKEFGLDDITRKTSSTGVAWYATSKLPNSNQYGRIESTHNFIICHDSYFPVTPSPYVKYTSLPIFGGDCYITRTTVQTKHPFFTQDQAGPLSKDGEEFDYRLYRNVGYPRFWANFFKYDFSELISKDVTNFATFSRTVTSRHNLDNKGDDNENVFRVDNAYFYISNNGVLDFFCESDFNTYFLEKPDNDTYKYSNKFTTLSEIFRSDRLKKEEQFHYDTSLNHQANEFFAQTQPITYPEAQNTYSPNRLNYSLASYGEQQFDNWQYFLTANSYQFSMSEFGRLTSLHRVDGERILFLFDRSSPYITLGRNQLQTTSDLTITIGDGGIFAQPPRELLFTEQHYGNSQSRFAAISSQFGTFYVSERQGRVFNFSGGLKEITREGIYFWTKEYMPIKLTSYFPDFRDKDNFVVGVGYQMALDSIDEVLYISKKDYKPKEEFIESITYDSNTNQFHYNDTLIALGDIHYFDNLSFTRSYSPSQDIFVSFHDWIPDYVLLSENHFLTVKNNSIWRHNSNPAEEPCIFYGIKYPFEIGFSITNKMQVKALTSLEYYLECFKYVDRRNKVHILTDNFDKLMVSNSEQFSGLLTMIPEPLNPYEKIKYPIPNTSGFTTLFSKVENRYRVDKFFDITRDREDPKHLLHYLPNGYERVVNVEAINPLKDPRQRKLFRHYDNQVWLAKENPIYHMIFKLLLTKQQISPR